MRLTLRSRNQASDIVATTLSPGVTLGELLSGAGFPLGGDHVRLDDDLVSVHTPISELAISDGSVVETTFEPESLRGEPGDVVADLVRVAGRGSAEVEPLTPGDYDLGTAASDDVTYDVSVRLVVDNERVVAVPLSEATVTVGGETVDRPKFVQGALIDVSVDGAPESLFSVRMRPERGLRREVRNRPGKALFLRPPRRQPVVDLPAILVPDPPEPAPKPQQLSVVMLLAPIPLAVVMAFLANPRFLLMAAMSPLMLIARWWETKRQSRKGHARIAVELAERAASYEADLSAVLAAVSAARLSSQPDLGELGHRVDADDPRLWERRQGHADFLQVTVGYGDVPYSQGLDARSLYPPLDAIAANAVLRDVPITVSLDTNTAVGVAGERATCRQHATALIAEAVINHGPADLQLAFLTRQPSLWDWGKWLPHVVDTTGALRVGFDDETIRDLLKRLDNERGGGPIGTDDDPILLLVVDGDDMIDAVTTQLRNTMVDNDRVRVLAIGSTLDLLPTTCTALIDLDVGGRFRLIEPQSGTRPLHGLAVLAARTVVDPIVRGLARLIDPERKGAAIGIPDQAMLVDLLGDATEPEGIRRAWEQSDPKKIAAVVGVTQDGPLTIDMVADGPHGLVAGTTGSGKSELLRSMVAGLACTTPPDRLSFILIDFKGGGAFDVCEDLPHTVAVVTDLDEHLAMRALTCLKAELKYRERLFRDYAVSSITDYWKQDTEIDLPRMLIIVDEFATMAAELPDFMDALVDIAQRGRSLGIHLILATQRPAGVLDGKIRANTNLRIALRVQDAADSTDVIGVRTAADLDRRHPGRAVARLGASDLVTFQSALVTGVTEPDDRVAVEIAPFELASLSAELPHRDKRDADKRMDEPEAMRDLEKLVIATNAVFEELAMERPRVPWPDPLPTALSPADLSKDSPPGVVAFGLSDLPDEQRQETRYVDPATGNLIVYGMDSSATASAVTTLTLGLASDLPPDQLHIYIIDGGGSLSGLEPLPHVAGYVGLGDNERIERLVARLESELDGRRNGLRHPSAGGDDSQPLVVLVAHNVAAIKEWVEELPRDDLMARLSTIIRDGPNVGLMAQLTATSERGVPFRLVAEIEQKFVMRLADPSGYTAFGLRTKDVPEMQRLRAIDTVAKREMQIAEYGLDVDTTVAEIAAQYDVPSGSIPQLATLPRYVSPAFIETASVADDSVRGFAIGQRYDNLRPAVLELRDGQHALVAGAVASGRTTTLCNIAVAARNANPDCRLVAIGSDLSQRLQAIESAVEDQEQLEELVGLMSESDAGDDWPAGSVLVLVDDVGLVDPETQAVLERITSLRHKAIHIVAAGTAEDLAGYSSWIKPLRNARTGILLQPHPEDGEVLRTRLPLRGANTLPRGRGFLVSQGVPTIVQLVGGEPPESEACVVNPFLARKSRAS